MCEYTYFDVNKEITRRILRSISGSLNERATRDARCWRAPSAIRRLRRREIYQYLASADASGTDSVDSVPDRRLFTRDGDDNRATRRDPVADARSNMAD